MEGALQIQLDKPGEECGVFGIYAPGADVARLAYFGLFALQHRGQESAGIAAADGDTITVYKDLGLVAQVFDESTLAGLTGDLAVGHVRYSTTGSSSWENSQPVYRQVGDNGLVLAHNGNLTNTRQLAEDIGKLFATSDSDLMTEALSQQMARGSSLAEAVRLTLPRFDGAYTLALMDNTTLVGVRDPMGFRPMCVGRIDSGWVIASETSALDILGAKLDRELAPGEMVVIDEGGPRFEQPFETTAQRLCVFEFVYFARPDSILRGNTIMEARQTMGRHLAEQAPSDADVVVPVPESGIPAAQGYAAATGIPYSDGLVKNRYVGRTFIEPDQSMRDRGVRMKLNPMPAALSGKRVVLVDDSIVRGSTTRQLIRMIREAGAIEVHLRISSPPYRWPCFYGMDTGDRSTLLAADRSVTDIADFLDVDSLAYLELDRLLDAAGGSRENFCTACLSGEYPTDVPVTDSKHLLEQT